MANSVGVEFIEECSHKVSRRIDDYRQTEKFITGKSKLRVCLHDEAAVLMLSALKTRFNTSVMPLLCSTDCLLNP